MSGRAMEKSEAEGGDQPENPGEKEQTQSPKREKRRFEAVSSPKVSVDGGDEGGASNLSDDVGGATAEEGSAAKKRVNLITPHHHPTLLFPPSPHFLCSLSFSYWLGNLFFFLAVRPCRTLGDRQKCQKKKTIYYNTATERLDERV
ncbi:uncharacterized protein Dana_GF27679 [Drosophila ananassae]|uniref:Uncharacterized protein n=1 Tax=Drosophila ananassae TaxID=7217 RepID=A0A0P8YKY5_DROAN|nr:uncharacterized protein Dana_GF27679 [Drosophila ananassae]